MNWEKFTSPENLYIVVGVSQDHAKYGYRVWKHLRLKQRAAVPVNPKYAEVDGEKCFPSLDAAVKAGIGKVERMVVITIVPPKVTALVVQECIRLGIKKVWMQPGSEDELVIAAAVAGGLQAIHHACMVRDGFREDFLI